MTFPFDVTVASSVRTAVGRANKGTFVTPVPMTSQQPRCKGHRPS